MTVPLGAQIAVSLLWLLLYVIMSVRYDRRWDARMRAALGRRLGADVRWARVDASGDAFSDDATGAVNAWHADGDGPLGRQLWQEAAARGAYLAVLVVLGALPPLALLGVEFLLGFHALVVLATAFAVIPVFSLFWLGNYRLVNG
jgi:hypothetical protein